MANCLLLILPILIIIILCCILVNRKEKYKPSMASTDKNEPPHCDGEWVWGDNTYPSPNFIIPPEFKNIKKATKKNSGCSPGYQPVTSEECVQLFPKSIFNHANRETSPQCFYYVSEDGKHNTVRYGGTSQSSTDRGIMLCRKTNENINKNCLDYYCDPDITPSTCPQGQTCYHYPLPKGLSIPPSAPIIPESNPASKVLKGICADKQPQCSIDYLQCEDWYDCPKIESSGNYCCSNGTKNQCEDGRSNFYLTFNNANNSDANVVIINNIPTRITFVKAGDTDLSIPSQTGITSQGNWCANNNDCQSGLCKGNYCCSQTNCDSGVCSPVTGECYNGQTLTEFYTNPSSCTSLPPAKNIQNCSATSCVDQNGSGDQSLCKNLDTKCYLTNFFSKADSHDCLDCDSLKNDICVNPTSDPNSSFTTCCSQYKCVPPSGISPSSLCDETNPNFKNCRCKPMFDDYPRSCRINIPIDKNFTENDLNDIPGIKKTCKKTCKKNYNGIKNSISTGRAYNSKAPGSSPGYCDCYNKEFCSEESYYIVSMSDITTQENCKENDTKGKGLSLVKCLNVNNIEESYDITFSSNKSRWIRFSVEQNNGRMKFKLHNINIQSENSLYLSANPSIYQGVKMAKESLKLNNYWNLSSCSPSFTDQVYCNNTDSPDDENNSRCFYQSYNTSPSKSPSTYSKINCDTGYKIPLNINDMRYVENSGNTCYSNSPSKQLTDCSNNNCGSLPVSSSSSYKKSTCLCKNTPLMDICESTPVNTLEENQNYILNLSIECNWNNKPTSPSSPWNNPQCIPKSPSPNSCNEDEYTNMCIKGCCNIKEKCLGKKCESDSDCCKGNKCINKRCCDPCNNCCKNPPPESTGGGGGLSCTESYALCAAACAIGADPFAWPEAALCEVGCYSYYKECKSDIHTSGAQGVPGGDFHEPEEHE